MREVQGLSSADIGLLLGITQVSRTVSGPIIGLLADTLKAPKQLAISLAVACVLAFSSLLFSHKLMTLLLLCSLANCLYGAIMPLGESLAVTRLPVGAYGRVRLWGSVAFIIANVVGGQVIHATGAGLIMPMMVGYSMLLAFACMQLPGQQAADFSTSSPELNRSPESPRSEAASAASKRSKPSAMAEARSLVSNVKFITFLVTVSLIQGSHAAYYSFGTIMLQQAGHSGSMIGMLWGVGVAAEVPSIFLPGHCPSRRLQPASC